MDASLRVISEAFSVREARDLRDKRAADGPRPGELAAGQSVLLHPRPVII